MLSQSLVSSRSISLSQQPAAATLQRSSSACLNPPSLPLALKRSSSGSVQHTSLVATDQLGTSQQVTQAATQVVSSHPATLSPTKPRKAQDSDFKANFGTAVRTLREDIPCTLQRSPNMDIFAGNIAFTDNISPRMGHQTNVIQGIDAYSRQLWSLRFHAALLFSKSHVEMLRMWQRDDKRLAVRWSVQCSPRLIGGVTGGKIRLDGVSEYKFNNAGKVVKHTVDVINWNGLHNALGLNPSQLAAKLLPTPSCCSSSNGSSNSSMGCAGNC